MGLAASTLPYPDAHAQNEGATSDHIFQSVSIGRLPEQFPQLEAVLRKAALQSPTMVRKQLEVAQQDASRFRGWWTYVPEVNMNYNIGVFHEIREGIDEDQDTRVAAEYILRADQPLYTWGAWTARRKLAFTREDIAEEDAFLTYATLVNELRAAYLSLVSAKAEADLRALRAQNAQRRVREMESEAAQGRRRPMEVESSRLELQSRQLNAERFALVLEQRFNEFRQISGALEIELDSLPALVEVPGFSIEDLESRLEAFRREGFGDSTPAKLAEHRQAAIGHELTIQRARQKPLFNLGAAIRQGPEEGVDGDYELQTIFFAGITGTWNLFDRRETQDNIRSLRIRRRLVDAELAIERDRRVAAAENALANLKIGRHSLDLQSRLVRARTEDLKQVQSRIDQGQADEGEREAAIELLRESELSLTKESARMLNAYYAFLGALLEDPALAYYQDTPSFESRLAD
ncbi:MAG: TolC family protein [Opitutales bacterium]